VSNFTNIHSVGYALLYADRTDNIMLIWVFHNFLANARNKAQRGFGIICRPIPVATQSNSWLCGRSLFGIVGFESRREHGRLSLVSVVCGQVEVSASSRSLVQRSPTERGVFNECEREAPLVETMSRNMVEAPQERNYFQTKHLQLISLQKAMNSFTLRNGQEGSTP